jgi:hypothetical protein
VLTTSCEVNGDLVVGASDAGAALLTVQGASLTMEGNVILQGAGTLTVTGQGSALQLDNQSDFQRSIETHGSSSLVLDGCSLVTNLTGSGNLTSSLNAYDSSTFSASDVTIDTSSSWLLGNFFNGSTATVSNCNVPVESYVQDECTLTATGAGDNQSIWLVLQSGTTGSITLPDPSAPFTWAVGRDSGQSVGWQVHISDALPGVGIQSHAGSSWDIHGSGSATKEATIAVYVDPATTPAQPMIFANLPLNTVGTSSTPFSLTAPGESSPQLSLYGVNIGPIGWQLYVGSGGAPSASAIIRNSTVNEVAAFTNGFIEFNDSVAQLAVLAAEGQNASLQVVGSEVWSQRILAGPGGTIQIETSSIHGSVLESDPGGGLQVADAVTVFYADGDSATCDAATLLTYLSAHNGVPECNPFSNLGQLSQRVSAGGAIAISGAHPACFAGGSAYVPGFLFDMGSNTASPMDGSVQCSGGSQPLSATFSAYPVGVPGATAGDTDTCVVTTASGTDTYMVTAPTCE